MVDLVVIGAIIHFCFLGYRIMQAYEYDIYNREFQRDEE